MDYFRSGLKSVLGSQQAADQPSGAETVERLVERVLSSTLLEDRRDACRALKSLSRKYRVEVGAHGMTAFTNVLQTDYADCEIVGYALDALCNITSDENYEEEEWQDANYKSGSNLGAQFTEIFIKQPDNVGLVLSFLEEYDFRVRWPAVKLLKSLLCSKPKEVQDIVLVSPMGVSKLMDLLSDSREVIRNDALLLLLQLTKGNANIQKIVAFENAFDRLFDVINDEGYADGDIVVEDCLHLMLNLLKNNVSNQNFFKEGSYIQRLTPMFNILNDDELDVGLTPQKISNINAVLQIIRTLVSPANPNQAITSCQRALRAAGIVEKLCNILMAGGVPVDVLTETIVTVAEVIRGNLSNQEYFASVMAPSTPPREAIVVLLMSMVNERQPFFLRCAVLYCFQCFLYRNELGQTKLIQTLLPSSTEQATVTAGQLLCGGLFGHDPLSHWLSSVALSHALIENPAAKESMLRVLLTLVSGHTPLSLLHHVTLLLQQSNKVQSRLGLLILLATWLSHCPAAIRHFLSIDTSISYLTTQAGASEHDDNEELVQGLCAFIMGICTVFNDDSVPSFSKENLRQLINKRVGLEVFLDKLNEVSRHELYSRAVKHPNIRATSPNDLLLDHEFCKLFKALEGLVMKAVTVSAAELTNGPTENIEQYKNLIREQDKRITELSMHYEALRAQNIQHVTKIQELTDQNLILKAQLTTTAATTQQNNFSEDITHVLHDKDRTIATLEEELKHLRSQSHLDTRGLSAAESQALDSEIIYLKSQAQALHQTEKELNELRKDQEDLLELVADQEREIETLKSQLQTYKDREVKDKDVDDHYKIEVKKEENQFEPEEKHEATKFLEIDLVKDSKNVMPPPAELGPINHHSNHVDAESTSPLTIAPSLADFKTETVTPGLLVNQPGTTPESTPTPPTQISESSRSTPNIFSPPLSDPKSHHSAHSSEVPSAPVSVPLSALSSEPEAPQIPVPSQVTEIFSPISSDQSPHESPVSETCSLLASRQISSPSVPPESQPSVNFTANLPPPTSSIYSMQPVSTHTSQSVPPFRPNLMESDLPPPYSQYDKTPFRAVGLPTGNSYFPYSNVNQSQPGVSIFSPPSNSYSQTHSGVSIFTPPQSEGAFSSPISDYSPQNTDQAQSDISILSPFSPDPIQPILSQPNSLHSSQPTTVFTPIPQPATYPYQQNNIHEEPLPNLVPSAQNAETSQPSAFSPASVFSFQSNDSSPFSSLFPSPIMSANKSAPLTNAQSPVTQQGGLFSFISPSSYFSSQNGSSATLEPTNTLSAQSPVMSNSLFQS